MNRFFLSVLVHVILKFSSGKTVIKVSPMRSSIGSVNVMNSFLSGSSFSPAALITAVNSRELPSAIGGSFGRVLHLAFVVLAVGDEDERLVAALTTLECLEARVDGVGERRAALGDDADIHGAQTFRECLVVESQRTLHEGAAGKGDQADTIAAQLLDEVLHGELGTFETVCCTFPSLERCASSRTDRS